MLVKITNPHSPYSGQEGLVTRANYGAHVDLLLTLDNGLRIRIDAEWTDYWEKKGEKGPQFSCGISVERARQVGELLRRWKLQAGAERETGEM